MPLCTTGSVDIVIDPTLVTVADATGFSIGDTIVFANAVGAGQDLVTTITGISGNQISLQDPASATVSDEQFCLVGGGGGWFGPQTNCACTCSDGCTCEAVVTDFGDTLLSLTGAISGASYRNSYELSEVCRGFSPATNSYIFPGFSGDAVAIDDSQCAFQIAQSDEIPLLSGARTLWGGTSDTIASGTYGAACEYTHCLWSGYEFSGALRHSINRVAGVSYSCPDVRSVAISVSYCLSHTALFYPYSFHSHADMSAWTPVDETPIRKWTYSDAGVNYLYEWTSVVGPGTFSPAIVLRIFAWTESGTVVDLADAPAFFDPLGLMVGRVEVT